MTLEELLQNHLRGCFIRTIEPFVVDGELKQLKVVFHSGQAIEIGCFGLHGMDAGMEIRFKDEVVQL